MKKHWWGFIGISSFLFRFLFARCAWFMFCFLGCLLVSIQLLYLLSLTQWAWSSWLEVIYLFIYIFLFLVSTRNSSIRWVIRRALRLFRNWFSTAWILLVLKVKKKTENNHLKKAYSTFAMRYSNNTVVALNCFPGTSFGNEHFPFLQGEGEAGTSTCLLCFIDEIFCQLIYFQFYRTPFFRNHSPRPIFLDLKSHLAWHCSLEQSWKIVLWFWSQQVTVQQPIIFSSAYVAFFVSK